MQTLTTPDGPMRKLTDTEFNYLKELYVDRIVEGMMTKDLVRYVMEREQEWIDSLTYTEAMDELESYFDEMFTDTIDEALADIKEFGPDYKPSTEDTRFQPMRYNEYIHKRSS